MALIVWYRDQGFVLTQSHRKSTWPTSRQKLCTFQTLSGQQVFESIRDPDPSLK